MRPPPPKPRTLKQQRQREAQETAPRPLLPSPDDPPPIFKPLGVQ